jgi:integrase
MAENIRKRGATYSFRINVKNPATGKWKNIERSGFKTVAEAKAAMAAMKVEAIETPESVLVKDKPVTLTEVYKGFIEKYATKDREQSTIKKYDSLFRNHLEPKWGNRQMSTIQASEISEYLFAMTATHAYAYIMSLHKFIGVLWSHAVKHKYMKNNIYAEIETPKADSSDDFIEKIYTEEELDKMEARFSSTNLITAYKIGRALGVRIAECFGLRWSDVNWEKHTIWVKRQMVYEDKMWCLRNTKTKAAIREIDLQDKIYYYLKDLKAKQEQQKEKLGAAYHQTRIAIDKGRNHPKTIEENPDLINLKENGEYLSTDSAKVLYRIAKNDCNIHFKYHNLRHTHASWLAEHNIPAIVVKKRLGHTKEATTLKYYNHITEGMRSDLLDKLNGVYTEEKNVG